MQGYGPDSYGEGFADVYDDWYGDLPGLQATVERVTELAGAGPVLELGCGTGRLLLPLAEAGLPVVGLDASAAMLARLRAKPGGAELAVHQGDMADFDLHHLGPFAVVFVAFNSLFNLPTAAQQAQCFRTVAAHLAPGGRFALECFVPGDAPSGTRDAVELHTLTADRVVLRVSRQDPTTQTVTGQHVDITEAGIRLRPWHLHYASPAELDGHALAAGLTLESRTADWRGTPFTDDSAAHVSVFRR